MAMPLTIQNPMFLTICLVLLSVTTIATKDAASKTVGPVFIFGDSTVDVGTNVYLKNCRATVNHPYYGIDYQHSKATGRFSNGLNPADTIVQLLGGYIESPPPFLALLNKSSNFTEQLLQGVNFASGGAALVKGVGKDLVGEVVSLEEQIQQFATVRGNITTLLGESKGQLLLQGSMYIISIGSNDITNYVFSLHSTSPEIFIANLTAIYANHLKKLYSLGARKFGLISVSAIGCCPVARILFGGECASELNDLARAFYTPFESQLKNLSSTLEGFKYSLGNSYNMTMNIIENPIGFKDVKTACCGNHPILGISDCKEGGYLCPNRDDHLFWDAFHPSQAAAKLAAQMLVFGEDPEFVTPINFSTLRSA